MSAFKKNMPECTTCNCGSATTTHGAGCSNVCPSGMPLTITITPVGGFGSNVWQVPTALAFSATGSGNSFTDNNLIAAHGNPFSAWWSAPIPDGTGLPGHYFQWCYNCGGGTFGNAFGSLSLLHNFTGSGGASAGQTGYNFDVSSSCSPFLQTGTPQDGFGNRTTIGPIQQWVASG